MVYIICSLSYHCHHFILFRLELPYSRMSQHATFVHIFFSRLRFVILFIPSLFLFFFILATSNSTNTIVVCHAYFSLLMHCIYLYPVFYTFLISYLILHSVHSQASQIHIYTYILFTSGWYNSNSSASFPPPLSSYWHVSVQYNDYQMARGAQADPSRCPIYRGIISASLSYPIRGISPLKGSAIDSRRYPACTRGAAEVTFVLDRTQPPARSIYSYAVAPRNWYMAHSSADHAVASRSARKKRKASLQRR